MYACVRALAQIRAIEAARQAGERAGSEEEKQEELQFWKDKKNYKIASNNYNNNNNLVKYQ